ncbi:MAG: GNAT family N-acetyltransferase [Rhodothermaceae bacterium]|nr:GNAT family N-acetyltransferase [Rhodothermaceae bacterium]
MQPPSSSQKSVSVEHDPVQGSVIVKTADFSDLDTIRELNVAIFNEERVINTFDRKDLLMLIAYVRGVPVGFKIGYQHSNSVFYSAKGGVLESFRRQGIARVLLEEMVQQVRRMGYRRFIYDTFPNKNPGMTILGLNEGFKVVKADFNSVYKDYRLQLEIEI